MKRVGIEMAWAQVFLVIFTSIQMDFECQLWFGNLCLNPKQKSDVKNTMRKKKTSFRFNKMITFKTWYLLQSKNGVILLKGDFHDKTNAKKSA